MKYVKFCKLIILSLYFSKDFVEQERVNIVWGGEEGGDLCTLWQLFFCTHSGIFSFASFVSLNDNFTDNTKAK